MFSYKYYSIAVAVSFLSMAFSGCADFKPLAVIPGTQAACIAKNGCESALQSCLVRTSLLLDVALSCGKIVPASNTETATSHLHAMALSEGPVSDSGLHVPMHHPGDSSSTDLCNPGLWFLLCTDAEKACRQKCQTQTPL